MNRRMLMLARHSALVRYESALFSTFGFDVVTYWNIKGGDREISLTSSHPSYNLTLSEDELRILSRIDWGEGVWPSIQFELSEDKEIGEFIAEHYDAVYVSTVSNWLDGYAFQAALAGKLVIFRVYGAPLTGCLAPSRGMRVLDQIAACPAVWMIPVTRIEMPQWAFWRGKISSAMAHVDPRWLFGAEKYQIKPEHSVVTISSSGAWEELHLRCMKAGIPYRGISYKNGWVPAEEVAGVVAGASVYVDYPKVSANVVKYAVLEAITLGVPVITAENGGLHWTWLESPLQTIIPYTWNNAEAVVTMAEYLKRFPNTATTLAEDQARWLTKELTLARETWSKILT